MASRESMIAVQTQAAGPMNDSPFSVSLSMPASPSGLHLAQVGMPSVHVADASPPSVTRVEAQHPAVPQLLKQAQHHSQPSVVARGKCGEERTLRRSQSTQEGDCRFDDFRTISGGLEGKLSALRLVVPLDTVDIEHGHSGGSKISDEEDDVPSATLEGPMLENHRCLTPMSVKTTEMAVLPKDKACSLLLWFPISTFGVCLGVNSQAMLLKTLQTEPSMSFLRVHPAANYILWWVSIALTILVSITYVLKVVFYFEVVRREFHHPVRVNFFFAPWIACLFLVKGVPRPVDEIHHVVWYILMAPILCLDLKIYGQWMSSGERRLSKVANPSNHLAVVGNFVGALLGTKMGLRELPIFFFAVGLAHYTVLFVTLYQRLPTNVQLPKDLHPVFFFFVATPSVASMAWAKICGEFNHGAKLAYFVSMFLYASLVVRVNLFRGIRFSLAWWAYTFPMTSVALATVLYASAVENVLTRALAAVLSGVAILMVTGVLITTVYHAFVRGDLFPNDVLITITRPRPTFGKTLANLWPSNSNAKELIVSIPSFKLNPKVDTYSDDIVSNSMTSNS